MPSGQTVVLDSGNLDAIVKDATGEGLPQAEKPAEAPVEAKPEAKEPEKASPSDEVDEYGLTEKERDGLTKHVKTVIGKKHRQMREAEEFATEQYNVRRLAEQRAEALERENARLKAEREAREPAKVADDERPKREAYDSDEKYRDALDDWRVDQKFKAKEAERLAALEQERQAEVMRVAASRIAHALEVVPDYREVTGACDWVTPPAVAGYMQESEMFAELGYYLAQHPEAREKLTGLTPAKQLVEIGKIESTLQPFSTAKVEKVTNGVKPSPSSNGAEPSHAEPTASDTGIAPSKPRAAAPIKPLTSGSAVVEKPESEMDGREALAKWQRSRGVNLNRRSRH